MALDAFASYNRNDPNPRETVRNSFPGTNAGKNVPRPADCRSRGADHAGFVPAGYSGWDGLDRHHLLFLGDEDFVDFLDEGVGEFLDFVFKVFLSVFGKSFLLEFLQVLDGVATGVADTDLGAFAGCAGRPARCRT